MVACSSCTFENADGAVECAMCGAALPQASVERKRKADDLSSLQALLAKPPTEIVSEEVMRGGVTASDLRRMSGEIKQKVEHIAILLESRAADLDAQPSLQLHVVAQNADARHSTVRIWLGGLDKRSPAFVSNGTRLQAIRMDGEFIVVMHSGEEHWLKKTNSRWDTEPSQPTALVPDALVHFEGESIDRGNFPESFKAMARASHFKIVSQVKDPTSSSAEAWRRGEEYEHCGYSRRDGIITKVLIGSSQAFAEISVAYVVDAGDCQDVEFAVHANGDATSALLSSQHGLASESELAAFASKSGLVSGAFEHLEKDSLHVLLLDMVWSCTRAATCGDTPLLERGELVKDVLSCTLGDIMCDLTTSDSAAST